MALGVVDQRGADLDGVDYLREAASRPTGDLLLAEGDLVTQLERKFKLVAFFEQVPLDVLALAYPDAARAADKEAFLAPHLETLRALIILALDAAPSEVGRLADAFPEVARRLARFRPGR